MTRGWGCKLYRFNRRFLFSRCLFYVYNAYDVAPRSGGIGCAKSGRVLEWATLQWKSSLTGCRIDVINTVSTKAVILFALINLYLLPSTWNRLCRKITIVPEKANRARHLNVFFSRPDNAPVHHSFLNFNQERQKKHINTVFFKHERIISDAFRDPFG